MAPDHQLSDLGPLIDALVTRSDRDLRDRLLIEAVFALEGAGAAALWKRVAPERWRPMLERGSPAALPSPGQVEAVLLGELDPELPERRLVLVSPGRGLALGLGDVENGDGRLDLVEALLVVWDAVDDAEGELEQTPGLRPVGRNGGEDGGEIARSLSALQETRSAFDRSLRSGEDDLELLGTIERESRLTAGLLLGAMGSDGAGEGRREVPYDLGEPIRDACTSQRELARSQGIELEIDLQGSFLRVTESPRAIDLWRVTGALLAGAAAHLAPRRGGAVRVAWEQQDGGGRVVLAVAYGAGQPPRLGGEHGLRIPTDGTDAGFPHEVRAIAQASGATLGRQSLPDGFAFAVSWPFR